MTILRMLAFLALTISHSWALADCPRPLSMGWESWEPYMYRDQEGMLTGLDIEVIQQVAREINCRVEFIETPFKRHLIELKKGNIDLASSTQYKDDRAEYARFTIPYRTSRYSLIVRRGELDKYPFETFDEFKNSGIRLGITRGYLYGDRMASVIAKSSGNLDIEDVVAESINLRKLMVNRIDAFLADPVVIQKVAEEDENTDSFAVHPLHIHSTTFHFISSRQSVPKDLADKINNALIKLDNDGWIEKLTLKYHRIDE